MIYFLSDYSLGAHPDIMEALAQTNMEHTDGYGMDEHCAHAADLIKDMIGRTDCSVHMMVGGTPANVTTISAALRPYEAVIAARSGHIYKHETGAVEATGHKIIPMEGTDGKLSVNDLKKAWLEYEDEHTVLPKMVYISQPTELGTVYSLDEIRALRAFCDLKDMYLYIDGARLGTALTCGKTDLTLKDMAALADAFYIGGTKSGLLLGEALVITNPAINDHYRWMIKRQCGMLAKGRLLGVQFEALLKGGDDCLLYRIGRHENAMAKRLQDGILAMGYSFLGHSVTNQIFPILPDTLIEELQKDFFFYVWAPDHDGYSVIRLVTSWGTTEAEVDAFLAKLKELSGQ